MAIALSRMDKVASMEDVLEHIGGFGKFQKIILALMLSLEIPTAFLVFLPVFIGSAPPTWLCDGVEVNKSQVCLCKGNVTAIDSTVSVVAEWRLTCSSSWAPDAIVSFQFLGMLFGSIFVSMLSDWYGRRYCFFGITSIMAFGTVLTAAAPNYYVYCVARLFCGFSFAGFLCLTAVYSLEFLTPNWRPVASGASPLGVGIMLLGILAYYIRPWRILAWVTAIPFAALIFMFPFVPESPRWLLRNRRLLECHKVLDYMARVNGKQNIDVETLSFLMEKEISRAGTNKEEEKNVGVETVKVKRFSYLEFYRNSNLLKTTLCLQGIWFSWGVVYFGLAYNIRNMAGSPYLNIFCTGLMDTIGCPTAFFINTRYGRRKSLVLFTTLCAVCLVAIATSLLVMKLEMINDAIIFIVLTFMSRFFIAGARAAVRTLTGESFPTAVRNMGIGFVAGTASFGGALGPQLVFLGSYWPAFPWFGFALIAVAGSLISFLLKETNGQPLEDDVDSDSN